MPAVGPRKREVQFHLLQALVEAVKAQGRGCGDIGRMCAVAEALCRPSVSFDMNLL